MADEPTQRVLISDDPAVGGVQAHHRDFPEIRARGRSAADALEQLQHQLTRALDTALTDWRRSTIEAALAEVKALAGSTRP